MRQGYKVVRTESDGCYSAVVDYSYRIAYAIGMLSVPQPLCGPLCVFGTLNDAIRYKQVYFDHDECGVIVGIYECEYEPSQEDKIYLPNVKGNSLPLSAAPPGTQLAKSVMLTKAVDDQGGI
jgi:hypothetical protein